MRLDIHGTRREVIAQERGNRHVVDQVLDILFENLGFDTTGLGTEFGTEDKSLGQRLLETDDSAVTGQELGIIFFNILTDPFAHTDTGLDIEGRILGKHSQGEKQRTGCKNHFFHFVLD